MDLHSTRTGVNLVCYPPPLFRELGFLFLLLPIAVVRRCDARSMDLHSTRLESTQVAIRHLSSESYVLFSCFSQHRDGGLLVGRAVASWAEPSLSLVKIPHCPLLPVSFSHKFSTRIYLLAPLHFSPFPSIPSPSVAGIGSRRSSPADEDHRSIAGRQAASVRRPERSKKKKEEESMARLAPTAGTIYCCKHCGSHLAYAQHIVSKMFHSKHCKAYLFDEVVNVIAGESEDDRMMITGLHTVRDIFCVACGAILGWKYVSAFEEDQRYKEGKFILERCKIHSGVGGPPDCISESEEDDQGAM